MSDEAFKQQLSELYQGEVIGEVAINGMLPQFDDPVQRYKLTSILQLETDTKARLRPVLMELGIDLAETAEARQAGLQMATAMQGLNWQAAMDGLRDVIKPYVARYREIAAGAPQQYKAVAESMLVHEQSLYDFLVQELAGNGDVAIGAVVDQLQHKLPRP